MNEKELAKQKMLIKMMREVFGKMADIGEATAETEEEKNQIKKAKLCNRIVDLVINDVINDLQKGVINIPDNELDQHISNIMLAVTTLEEEAKAINKYEPIEDDED